jgi:hypothetical protein
MNIGIVTGKSPNTQGATSLGRMLKLLDAISQRYSLPVETRTFELDEPEAKFSVSAEVDGLLLGSNIAARPWLRELEGSTLVGAPFQAPGAKKSSLLVWPFEDANRMRAARGSGADVWIETSCLSRSGLEAAVRAAEALAKEKRQETLNWVYVGWGELEESALQAAQSILGSRLRVLPVEELSARLSDSAELNGAVLLTLGRTAVPASRLVGAQGWVAWTEKGMPMAQATGNQGPGLVMAFFLDRLGKVTEAAALEEACSAALQNVSPHDWASVDLTEKIIERMLHG